MNSFNNRKLQIKREELGVVCVSAQFIANLITAEGITFRPNHGVRNIKVHTAIFDSMNNIIVILISSPDIPAYVAYHKLMESLEHCVISQVAYPVIILGYEVLDLEIVDKPEDFGGYGCIGEDDESDE